LMPLRSNRYGGIEIVRNIRAVEKRSESHKAGNKMMRGGR
jgi:hypothetical protein